MRKMPMVVLCYRALKAYNALMLLLLILVLPVDSARQDMKEMVKSVLVRTYGACMQSYVVEHHLL